MAGTEKVVIDQMTYRMRSVRLPEHLWQALKARGEEERRTVNNLIEVIATEYLKENKA